MNHLHFACHRGIIYYKDQYICRPIYISEAGSVCIRTGEHTPNGKPNINIYGEY